MTALRVVGAIDWFPLWLSLRVATLAAAFAAVIGVGLAYALAKSRFPGRSLVEAIASLPIVLPPTVLGYYLLVALGARSSIGRAWESVFGHPLVFTPTAAVVAASVSAVPFVLRAARAASEAVDPRYEQAARTMGLAEWKVAALVTLPLARRGLIAGVALGFARALGDFGVARRVDLAGVLDMDVVGRHVAATKDDDRGCGGEEGKAHAVGSPGGWAQLLTIARLGVIYAPRP